MKSESIIIIIDDQIKGNDELLIVLKENYSDVITFDSSNEALKKLPQYYGEKIIVLLDLTFPHKEPDGHKVLEKIRTENELIPVIIWSAVNETESEFSDLINNSAFGFLKRDATIAEIMAMLSEADSYLDTSVGGALEDWIQSQPDFGSGEPYMITVDGTELSLQDLLKEVRLQTEIGKSFSKRLNKLTIDLLMRKKENLDGQ